MKTLVQILLYLSTTFAAFTSHATLITFENNNIRNTGLYQQDDFIITAPIDLVNGKLDEKPHLTAVGFAGQYLETWNTTAIFELTEATNKAFNLISLQVGSYFTTTDGVAEWAFKGYKGRDLINSLEVELLGQIVLNWQNITRFTIQSTRGSAASAFDNIKVEIPRASLPQIQLKSFGALSLPKAASVNEPKIVWLLVLAFSFLCLRKKTKLIS
ncbi:hypothetical protein [Paraglaciecola aestuariivivens]